MAYNGSLLGYYNEVTGERASGLWEFNEHYFFKKDNVWPKILSPFQGSVSGYTAGGLSPPFTLTNTIDKFPFASDTNASDVGDLVTTKGLAADHSSGEHGYVTSGNIPAYVNTIERFPFATDTNASDTGITSSVPRGSMSNSGSSSKTHGYTSGGFVSPGPGTTNIIDKFPFAITSNASDVGDLLTINYGLTAQSSSVSGYASGSGFPTFTNVIQKFSFSVDTNASDVGDLTRFVAYAVPQSSTESGYTSSGLTPPVQRNIIDKFPFASDSNATDVGDLTSTNRSWGAGQSSTESGYTSGGSFPNIPFYNIIDKFPFATDTNASDVGDLTVTRSRTTGHQI